MAKKRTVRANGTVRVLEENTEPSATQQQFKDDCDLNKIVERAIRTGEAIPTKGNQPFYADFTQIPDYETMLNTKLEIDNAFMSLSSKIRNRFHNNPAKLIDFLNDEGNREEAIAMGLLEPEIKTTTDTPVPSPEVPSEEGGE